ncbi:MAG: hypothetical protein RL497_263 [Pseudomonadota bacterium]|jgi:hypothetical protein
MRTLAALSLIFSLSACSQLQPEPWVKAYERGHLADPVMQLERSAISGKYMNHVYEAREAARGADGSAGGGCGCN